MAAPGTHTRIARVKTRAAGIRTLGQTTHREGWLDASWRMVRVAKRLWKLSGREAFGSNTGTQGEPISWRVRGTSIAVEGTGAANMSPARGPAVAGVPIGCGGGPLSLTRARQISLVVSLLAVPSRAGGSPGGPLPRGSSVAGFSMRVVPGRLRSRRAVVGEAPLSRARACAGPWS